MADDPSLDPSLQAAFSNIAGGTASTTSSGGGVGALINSYTSKSPYAAMFKAAGLKYNIDPRVLEAIVQNESANPNQPFGNPKALGPIIGQGPDKGKRAQGLMQVAPSTGAALGLKDPFDVGQNIDAAAHDLRDKLNKTDIDDYSKALNGYSGGGGQAYQDKFSNAYKALGGDPQALFNPAGPQPGAGQVADSNPDLDPDLQGHFQALDKDMQGIMASTSDDPRAATPVPGWGMPEQIANAVTFGQLPKIVGGATAAIGMLAGRSSPQQLSDTYNAVSQGLNQARTQYGLENPGHTLEGNVIGETAGQAAAITAGEGLLNFAGKGIAAIPGLGKLAPVGRFLMGTAGQDAETAAGLLARVGSRAAAGGRIGAESGAMQFAAEPDSGESLGDSMKRGAITGMLTNTALGPAVNDIKAPLRAETNFGVGTAAKTLADEGVSLKGSQIAVKPGQAFAGNVSAEQLADLTGAVVKKINPAATDTTLGADFFKRETDRISKGISTNTAGLTYDSQGQAQLAKVIADAQKEFHMDDPMLKQITKTVDRIDEEAGQQGMKLSPDMYRSLTQSDGAVTNLQQGNAFQAKYGNQIRDILDGMAERTAAASGPQGVKALADLQELRQQYKRLKIVQNATDPLTELVNPQKLSNGVNSGYSDYYLNKGGDDFTKLGQASKILPPPNQTGGIKSDATKKSILTPIERMVGLGALGGDFMTGLNEAIDVTHTHPMKTAAAVLGATALFGAKKVRDAIADSDAYRNLLMERAGVAGVKAPAWIKILAGQQNMLIPAVNSSRIGQTYLAPGGEQQ